MAQFCAAIAQFCHTLSHFSRAAALSQKQLAFGFLERGTGVSPIRRLYELEEPPVRVGVLLGFNGQGASK
ncbi:MAG: hypothetical protein EBS96_10860 [Spartobacteria bacterium]|nr:hypothetical protein [Spartobacteria bacterium]